MATITLGSNVYTLVPLPSAPGFTDISFSMLDSVAVVESPYVPSQTQSQRWPGADRWGMQATLPKMERSVAAPWIAFLAALRGKLCAFQLGDPRGRTPCGAAEGAPVVDGTIGGSNAVGQNVLNLRGFTAGIYRQLLPADYIQVVSRLYMVTAEVDSDSSGNAQVAVWPSLRETPADGAIINLINPVGCWRLANNQRMWHMTVDGLIQISMQAVEAR